MQHLSQDLWEVVAIYLSREELMALAALNRVFLNLALNLRYEEFEWTQPDQTMLHNLIRSTDPFIATRIRRLYIRSSFMQYLLRNPRDFEEPVSITAVGYGLAGKLYGFIAKFSPTSLASDIPLEGIQDRPRDIVRLMSQAITKMTNLRVFALESSERVLYKDTHKLFDSIRNVLSPYLQKIVLRINFTVLSGMLSGTTFLSLEELDLTFEFDNLATQELVVSLGSTITAIAPGLNTLKILSWSPPDLSQFFKALGPFPKLRHLSVRVPFKSFYLSNPSGLNQLLRQHRLTLRHLEVLPECWDAEDESQILTWTVFLEQCLLDLDQWPTNLETLVIPVIDFPTTMSLIRLVANTLTTLRLAYRYLTYFEIADAIDLFHHRSSELKHLSLDVTLVTPNLLVLLAHRLPGLSSLTLVIEDATDTVHSILRTDPNESDSIEWNLFDLSIFNKRFRDDSVYIGAPMSFEFEEGLMAQLSCLLPSVRSFKGRGHMEMIRIS